MLSSRVTPADPAARPGLPATRRRVLTWLARPADRPAGPGTPTNITPRQAAPFLLPVLVCELSPAIPHHPRPDGVWWLLSAALVAVTVTLGILAARRPDVRWLATLAPLALLPAIQALRAADGNAVSGFTPLLMLPTIWFGLYGRLRNLVITLVGCAVVLIVPIVTIGAPQFPGRTWRGSVLFMIVLATTGALTYRLVDSARRKAIALDTSERQFRAAFDDAPIGMALADGADAGRPLLVNHALCSMFGQTAAQLLERPIAALAHPDDAASLRSSAAATATPGQPAGIEVRMRHGSGRLIWASASCSVLPGTNGRATQTIWQFEDISARRQSDDALLTALETERRAADQLRQLERARTELISAVSHDLRTPITAALGYAELLADGDLGPLTDEQGGTVNIIVRGLNRLSIIIDELVTAAPGAAQDVTPLVDVEISTVLDAAIATVMLQVTSRKQQLSCSNATSGAHIEGDADRLERLLLNLLGNAAKFTPEGGAIDVDARVENREVVIAIADSGQGIAPEQQRLIFERFYRAPRNDDEAVSGTGIGLAIVKAIVTQHGGTIEVDSAPGHGTTFTVRLPLS